MAINRPRVAALLVVALFFGSFWYFGMLWPGVLVTGAGVQGVDGYYVKLLGGYIRASHSLGSRVPDAFTLAGQPPKLRQGNLVLTVGDSGQWLLAAPGGESPVLYLSAEPGRSNVLPPEGGWVPMRALGSDALPAPKVKTCPLAPREPKLGHRRRSGEGISALLGRPATAVLLAINLAMAYWLWSAHVSPESVAISYAAVWDSGEYWRIASASFSHFEIMHLAFNMMSLWNLGGLETQVGSLPYLYLSLDTAVATLVIVLLIQHMLVKRGREEQREKRAVGYSCVLFALMTYAAVEQRHFCPIPFVPSLCFDTWYLPVPGPLHGKLGINLAPFSMLFLVQFVMPRAGFLGHLAGIIVGYPLAWGLLNWATPPLAVACCALLMLQHSGGWPWRLPDYASLLQGWAAHEGEEERVRAARLARAALFAQAVLLLPPLLWLAVWPLAAAEVLALGVGYASLQAVKCCCHPDSLQQEHRCCLGLVKAQAATVAALLVTDSMSAGAILGKWCYLVTGGVDATHLQHALMLFAVSAMIHGAILASCVRTCLLFREGQTLLSRLGFSALVTRHNVTNVRESQGRLLRDGVLAPAPAASAAAEGRGVQL